MAKVVLKKNIALWRIIDGRSGKPLRTNYNRAVDDGGCRTEIDAHRLLKKYRDTPIPRKQQRELDKQRRLKAKQRLERIAANVQRKLAKVDP